jgi:hypothetical protein
MLEWMILLEAGMGKAVKKRKSALGPLRWWVARRGLVYQLA